MTGTGSPDMDERSLAAVTIVLTCGLRSAFASPDTSTSTDMSHSQQKDKVEKTNKQKKNPKTSRWKIHRVAIISAA